ncbi:MAG: helix-turn-helix domain-containing protein [Verrucomicrobiaceae bacterium]|nr:helix-turn-helix domain-containing protein [Verrucomicrobiaceae bacterium]
MAAATLGINRTTIYDWLALYRKGDWSALDSHKGGVSRITDELVWNGVNNHALGKLPHHDKPTMRKAAGCYLRSLQSSPSCIRALFQKPAVRYAA